MFKNKKLISTLLFLITLSICGCYPASLYYIGRGEVEIVLNNGKKLILEIGYFEGKPFAPWFVAARVRLVRKAAGIEFQYDKKKGHFIIRDGKNIIIGIPKVNVLERDGEKTYLISPSSPYYLTSSEWFFLTFKVAKILPPSFQFIIEEKETKRPLCNIKAQAKNWEEYRKYIKRQGYFRYYPQDDLQVSLVDGEKMGTEFFLLKGRLKGASFKIIMRLHFPDPIRERYNILFKKAYILDESKKSHKASAYVYGSNYGAQLSFSKLPKPPKKFSLFIPYIVKESSKESSIKIDFKVDEEELEEYLKVVESKEVPEPWKSNWFEEK